MKLPIPKQSKGFSLIELIMTIVIVSIIAIPVALMLGQHLQSVSSSNDYTMATNLARMAMEQTKNILSNNYADIPAPNSIIMSGYEGYNYNVTRVVTCLQAPSNCDTLPESIKQITIDVTKMGSSNRLIRLITYVAKNVGYRP